MSQVFFPCPDNSVEPIESPKGEDRDFKGKSRDGSSMVRKGV